MIRPVKFSEELKENILSRRFSDASFAEESVKKIIAEVKQDGDRALKKFTAEFDKAELSELKVGEEEIEKAFAEVDEDYVRILKTSAENIARFHEKQLP